jgi:DNA-binding XRE family transcriptional regulator
MGDVQVIRAGERELVVLERADYERLVEAAEMLEDVAAYDGARAALASGADELVPGPVADRLLSGANPVRVWREHRGLSAAALARAAEVSPGYLSQIETGARTPGRAALARLATALALTLDDLA